MLQDQMILSAQNQKNRLDDIWSHLHYLRYEELEQYFGRKVATKEELGAFAMEILATQTKNQYPEALLTFLHLRHICDDYDAKCPQMFSILKEYRKSLDCTLDDVVVDTLYWRYDGEMHRKKHSQITKDDWMRPYNRICENLEVAQGKIMDATEEEGIQLEHSSFYERKLPMQFTISSWHMFSTIVAEGNIILNELEHNKNLSISMRGAATSLEVLISDMNYFITDLRTEAKVDAVGKIDNYIEGMV